MDTHSKIDESLRLKALLFRVSAHVLLAVVAILLPAVGPNRFWFAAALLCLGTPAAIIVNQRVQSIERNWAEALVDLIMVVTLVHLIPHLWMVAMALGLMVALAPSIGLHPFSHWIYMGFGSVLLLGMTLAAVLHDVENWELVILAVTLTYPALLFYTYSQMQAANELRKRAEMVQGMTQLAGSMAHDFNNMLMGISGHAEVALAKLPPDHDVSNNLHKVLDGTKRASLLTKRLLSFAGRDLGQKDRINVVAEFRAIADLLRPALPPNISLAFTTSDERLFVEANADLHQVWMNILLNAGESMLGEEGVVDVHFSKTEATENSSTKQVALLISDRGSGIAQEAMDKVFDPFFTTKQKGHGLGLAVCQRIVQQLKGNIVIRERSGGGTEVLVALPEASPPLTKSETEAANETSPASDMASMTVLVVDDEADVRTAAADLLTNLGHKALTASSAAEAINIFSVDHQLIEAVLLDLKMPDQDGWSCLQGLRKISADKPIIICTGYNPVADQPDFALNDLNLQFLSKPFQSDQLVEALKKRNRKRSENLQDRIGQLAS